MDDKTRALLLKIIAQANESIVYNDIQELQDGLKEIKNSCISFMNENLEG